MHPTRDTLDFMFIQSCGRAGNAERYAAYEFDETEDDMLNKSNIVTCLATKKLDSAKDFYEQTLGLRLVYDDAFAIVFDANGIMLRVQKVSLP